MFLSQYKESSSLSIILFILTHNKSYWLQIALLWVLAVGTGLILVC